MENKENSNNIQAVIKKKNCIDNLEKDIKNLKNNISKNQIILKAKTNDIIRWKKEQETVEDRMNRLKNNITIAENTSKDKRLEICNWQKEIRTKQDSIDILNDKPIKSNFFF